MKKLSCALLLLLALILPARAAELPRELENALPQEAEELLRGDPFDSAADLSAGIGGIFNSLKEDAGRILRQRAQSAILILLVVLLCGAVDGLYQGAGGRTTASFLPMAGALSVTLLAAGSLDSLIGLGAETIEQLHTFSKFLLPTLAAAVAAGGAVGTATVQQVATVFFVDLLLQLINGLLLPLVYLYIGALTAGAMLPENKMSGIAEGLKKVIVWILSAALIAFTVYLSVVRVISGSADGAAVKVAKAAISGAVPVVGSIIAEASETVLAGAGLLRSTIGIFGTLSVLAICAYPFLQLGIQYLLYKLTAFLALTVGPPGLSGLINGLGSAFGLVLGMTGACALLLLVSVLSSVAAVIP